LATSVHKRRLSTIHSAEQEERAENPRKIAFIIQKRTTKFFQNILSSGALKGKKVL